MSLEKLLTQAVVKKASEREPAKVDRDALIDETMDELFDSLKAEDRPGARRALKSLLNTK